MEDQYLYTICTKCLTYNHSKYIRDALQGFSMQRTSFKTVYIIIDDASTDGAQNVIKSWISENIDCSSEDYICEEAQFGVLIKGSHKNNKNAYFVIFLLNENHYRKKSKKAYLADWIYNSKYVAHCEGDDYWTDSLKLQKQVDYLNSHPDYTFCFHAAIEHWENNEHKDRLFSKVKDRDYQGIEFFKNWIVPTASVVLRSSVYASDLHKKVKEAKLSRGDTPLFCTAASLGKVRGMKEPMSIYRKNEGSYMAQPKTFERISQYVCHMRVFPVLFGEEYEKISHKYVVNCIVDNIMKSRRNNNVDEALKYKSLLQEDDRSYLIQSYLSYPFRMIYGKYILNLIKSIR